MASPGATSLLRRNRHRQDGGFRVAGAPALGYGLPERTPGLRVLVITPTANWPSR